jgi:glycosyltransferase involved in cell wall biosynthesis
MKICITAPTYYPIIGGTETIIHNLGTHLVDLGYDVEIVTRKLNVMSKEEMIDGISTSRVFTLNNSLGVIPLQFALYNKLRRILNECDLIHQFHVYHMGLATIQAKKRFEKPFILSLMGNDTYDPIRPIPRFLNPYMAWVMNNADIVTSPSRDLEKYAIKQGLKKETVIIPHSIKVDRYRSEKYGRKNVREKLKLTENDIVILSVQRLYPRKKLRYLIEAAGIIIKRKPNIKFILVGKGPELANLNKLAKELGIDKNIIFTGFVPENDLPNYYSACDIFVLHSTYEAFGIVLIEAMASCKPIVSTMVGAVPEVVDHEKTGILVPPCDSKALAEAIERLIIDKELRRKMGKLGRQKAEKYYDWKSIAQRYIHLYEELL